LDFRRSVLTSQITILAFSIISSIIESLCWFFFKFSTFHVYFLVSFSFSLTLTSSFSYFLSLSTLMFSYTWNILSWGYSIQNLTPNQTCTLTQHVSLGCLMQNCGGLLN
jgi:hypothetical protein